MKFKSISCLTCKILQFYSRQLRISVKMNSLVRMVLVVCVFAYLCILMYRISYVSSSSVSFFSYLYVYQRERGKEKVFVICLISHDLLDSLSVSFHSIPKSMHRDVKIKDIGVSQLTLYTVENIKYYTSSVCIQRKESSQKQMKKESRD